MVAQVDHAHKTVKYLPAPTIQVKVDCQALQLSKHAQASFALVSIDKWEGTHVTAIIQVINPNSNSEVTQAISEAVGDFSVPGRIKIDCLTLREGPFGVESQADSDSVVMPLRAKILENQEAAAFVIACYSDPGLHACREASGERPVFGIAESGLLTAMARGDRFGVLAIGPASIARHRRYMRQMAIFGRFAGERALNMSVAETASGTATFDRMVAVGTQLRDEDGADVLVLGCAGMARHQNALETALGVPVIEPTRAAVAMAIGALPVGKRQDDDVGRPSRQSAAIV